MKETSWTDPCVSAPTDSLSLPPAAPSSWSCGFQVFRKMQVRSSGRREGRGREGALLLVLAEFIGVLLQLPGASFLLSCLRLSTGSALPVASTPLSLSGPLCLITTASCWFVPPSCSPSEAPPALQFSPRSGCPMVLLSTLSVTVRYLAPPVLSLRVEMWQSCVLPWAPQCQNKAWQGCVWWADVGRACSLGPRPGHQPDTGSTLFPRLAVSPLPAHWILLTGP